MSRTTERPNVEYGDATVALENEILRTVAGSGVHGIAIEGTDDRDEMGVFIEEPRTTIGTDQPMEHYIYRTQPEGARSGPGDVDLVIYALRKYLRLAAKGNPTALLPLYAPEAAILKITPLGDELRKMREAFLSKEAVNRFLGYMQGQHERMLGRGKQNRVPNRPELIERYGFDVKYAAHALRLAYQGSEIATHGTLTLPMRALSREHVLAVKRGEIPQAEVSAAITDLENDIKALLADGRTPLPDKPDWERISTWSVRAHKLHWGWD